MTAAFRAFAVASLLSLPAFGAEPEWPTPPRLRQPKSAISLSLANQSGIPRTPFVTSAFPEASGFVTVTTPSFSAQVAPWGRLRARLPLTYARVDFPAGAQVGTAALGNLEVSLDRGWALSPSTELALVVGWVAPTASRGTAGSLLHQRALALGSSLTANRYGYLFTPGTTGARVAASLEHTRAPFELRAALDLPLLVRVSDANLPEESRTRAFGIAAVLDAKAAWWVAPWFGVALGAAVVAEIVRAQEPARESDRDQRLQPLVEPSLCFRLGQHVQLALDSSIALGGALGGEAWSLGPSGRFDF